MAVTPQLIKKPSKVEDIVLRHEAHIGSAVATTGAVAAVAAKTLADKGTTILTGYGPEHLDGSAPATPLTVGSTLSAPGAKATLQLTSLANNTINFNIIENGQACGSSSISIYGPPANQIATCGGNPILYVRTVGWSFNSAHQVTGINTEFWEYSGPAQTAFQHAYPWIFQNELALIAAGVAAAAIGVGMIIDRLKNGATRDAVSAFNQGKSIALALGATHGDRLWFMSKRTPAQQTKILESIEAHVERMPSIAGKVLKELGHFAREGDEGLRSAAIASIRTIATSDDKSVATLAAKALVRLEVEPERKEN